MSEESKNPLVDAVDALPYGNVAEMRKLARDLELKLAEAEAENAVIREAHAHLHRICSACIAELEAAGMGAVGKPNTLSAMCKEAAAKLSAQTAAAQAMEDALAPLAKIADAYDDNALDDEARKAWGSDYEHINTTPSDQIELYNGRGGKRLLTLADCFAARAALAQSKEAKC